MINQYERNTCYFCGEDDTDVLEDHHIVPQRYGGDDSKENLVTVCGNCHNKLEKLYSDRFYSEIGFDGRSSTTEYNLVQLDDNLDLKHDEIRVKNDFERPENSYLLYKIENFGRTYSTRKESIVDVLERSGLEENKDFAVGIVDHVFCVLLPIHEISSELSNRDDIDVEDLNAAVPMCARYMYETTDFKMRGYSREKRKRVGSQLVERHSYYYVEDNPLEPEEDNVAKFVDRLVDSVYEPLYG